MSDVPVTVPERRRAALQKLLIQPLVFLQLAALREVRLASLLLNGPASPSPKWDPLSGDGTKKKGLASPQVFVSSKSAGARYVTRRLVRATLWAVLRKVA